MERIRKAREEHAKASAAQQQNLGDDIGPDASSIFGLLNDPELMEAFKVSL